MDMESSSSSWESVAVRTTAALSSTEGTDCSICSVIFPRGIRWGSEGVEKPADEGLMGSMSRSKMAEDDEWLRHDQRGNEEPGAMDLH